MAASSRASMNLLTSSKGSFSEKCAINDGLVHKMDMFYRKLAAFRVMMQAVGFLGDENVGLSTIEIRQSTISDLG
jgi:hypothetical protein